MLDERTIDDPWFAIADRIKRQRSELGFSRQDLATRLGVSRTTILNWESGRRIPVEKCAALAEGLSLTTDDLLELHPETPRADRLNEEPTTDGFRVTTRELAMAAIGALAVVIGIGFLSWSTASTDCFAVGAGLGSAAPGFLAAYEESGSRIELGCPIEEVRKWGDGVAQMLSGGSFGEAVILSLDRGGAVIIAGQLFDDWRRTAEGAAANVAGYPTTGALDCAGSLVLPLEGGIGGPGAMVQSGGDGYSWLYGDVWVAYMANGGPAGPLGRPLGFVTQTNAATVATFERGTITAPFGAAPVVTGSDGSPLDVSTCAPTDLATAAHP